MSGPSLTYDVRLLAGSEAKWRRSAALRAFYAHVFAGMRRELAPGKTLELGSGIGVAREHLPDLTTSDVVKTGYADRIVSAYAIPAESWGNIVACDVLHHLAEPFAFFSSAAAALAPGGRIVLVEPAATPWARLFYGLAHPEPCRPAEIHPDFRYSEGPDGFANMGMAHGLFSVHGGATRARLASLGLAVTRVQYRDVLAYPLTGGLSKPALLPAAAIRTLLGLESRLPQPVLRLLGLRMLVVLTKPAAP